MSLQANDGATAAADAGAHGAGATVLQLRYSHEVHRSAKVQLVKIVLSFNLKMVCVFA